MAIYYKSVVIGITPSQEGAGWTQGTFLSSLNGWNFYAFGFLLKFSIIFILEIPQGNFNRKRILYTREGTFNRTVVDQIAVIR